MRGVCVVCTRTLQFGTGIAFHYTTTYHSETVDSKYIHLNISFCLFFFFYCASFVVRFIVDHLYIYMYECTWCSRRIWNHILHTAQSHTFIDTLPCKANAYTLTLLYIDSDGPIFRDMLLKAATHFIFKPTCSR